MGRRGGSSQVPSGWFKGFLFFALFLSHRGNSDERLVVWEAVLGAWRLGSRAHGFALPFLLRHVGSSPGKTLRRREGRERVIGDRRLRRVERREVGLGRASPQATRGSDEVSASERLSPHRAETPRPQPPPGPALVRGSPEGTRCLPGAQGKPDGPAGRATAAGQSPPAETPGRCPETATATAYSPGPGSPPLTAGAQPASPPEGGCGSSSSSRSSTSHRECPRPSAVTSAGRGGWPGTAAGAPGPEDAARHLTPVAMGQGAPRSLRVGHPRSARADDPCHRSHLFRPPVWALRPRALEAAEAGP